MLSSCELRVSVGRYTFGLLAGFVIAFEHVGKTGRIVEECEVEFADGAVALLGNNDLGAALEVGVVLLVDLFAEDKHNNVGVLLDGAGFAEVGELGAMVAAAAFGSAAELGQSDNGHAQFFGDGFESAGDGRNFLSAILEALAAAGHQLQIIDNE